MNNNTANIFPEESINLDVQEKISEFVIQKPVSIATVPSYSLFSGEYRLDAGYYANKVASTFRLLRESKLPLIPIEQRSESIWYPGRFKRVYAQSKQDGIPFLTASNMLHSRPSSKMYLANISEYVSNCLVKPGWILVTRSGTVGRSVLVGKYLSQFAISDDAIRIQCKDILEGYVYAFLESHIGQVLLAKDKYGSAIKHLEPHHISSLPIPLLPAKEQEYIHEQIIYAYKLRDEANTLRDEAEQILYSGLGLPQFDMSLVP